MTQRARGPYAKSAAVRERIIEAAFETFAARGYQAATMKEIAAAADITAPGLSHHFRTKEELLDAVLAFRDRRHVTPSSWVDTDNVARRTIETLREDSAQPNIVALHAMLSAEATDSSHPAHDRYRGRYADFKTHLSTVFAAAQERGDITADVDPRVLATLLIAVMDGVQLQWLYDPDDTDIDATLSALFSCIAPGLLVDDLGRPAQTAPPFA
ncbi:TetR family transcriptional regulator [Microbacterium laevaniformans]|uniref:TetR family transcriptional regulator n=1 Tax=Microbacterium laevaniformans TaxID=36807 RepID=UPI00362B7603